MKDKIVKFFKSDLFKDSLKYIFELFIISFFILFIIYLLINAIYYGVNLVNTIPCDIEALQFFETFLFKS